MATNLPSCFSIQFLEHLQKFLINFTLLKYVNCHRSYGFLITKELIFGFQILDLKDHFSASLTACDVLCTDRNNFYSTDRLNGCLRHSLDNECYASLAVQ